MACRQHRNGDKFHGKHTTYIDTAAEIADYAITLNEVTAISTGIIKSGIGNCGGKRYVKILNITWGNIKNIGIMLVVRENGSAQRIYIHSNDIQKTKLLVAKYATNNNIHVNFTKN